MRFDPLSSSDRSTLYSALVLARPIDPETLFCEHGSQWHECSKCFDAPEYRGDNPALYSGVMSISLFCPACKKQQNIRRCELDPPRATSIHLLCPECGRGDFAAPTFFAADGSEVPFEEGIGGQT